jgi:hypothetical protein
MSDQRQPTCFQANEGVWLRWLGHPIRYLATEAETGGRYCMSIGTAGNGQGAPPHRHDFDEGSLFCVAKSSSPLAISESFWALATSSTFPLEPPTIHASSARMMPTY